MSDLPQGRMTGPPGPVSDPPQRPAPVSEPPEPVSEPPGPVSDPPGPVSDPPQGPARVAGPPEPGAAGNGAGCPRLSSHARLTFDEARQKHVLLTPESVAVLNDTGAAVLGLCDGQRTVAGIIAELRGRYDRVAEDEVQRFLDRLVARRCVEVAHG